MDIIDKIQSRKMNRLVFILVVVCLTRMTNCQTNTTTEAEVDSTVPVNKDYAGSFGVGYGIVIVFIAFILGILVCIAGRFTENPMMLVIAGTLLPIVTFLIIYLLPKQSTDVEEVIEEGETQTRPIFFAMLFVLIYLCAIASYGLLIHSCILVEVQTYSFDTGASGIIIEKEKKPKRSMKKEQIRQEEYMFLQRQEVERKDHTRRGRPLNMREIEIKEKIEKDPLRRKNWARKLEPLNEEVLDRELYNDRMQDRQLRGQVLTQEGELIDQNRFPQYQDQEQPIQGRDQNDQNQRRGGRNFDESINVALQNRRNLNLNLGDDQTRRTVRMKDYQYFDEGF